MQSEGRETWKTQLGFLDSWTSDSKSNYHCCKWSLLGGLTVEQGVKTTATNILTCLNRSAIWGKTVADCRRGPRSQSVGPSMQRLYGLHATVKHPSLFAHVREIVRVRVRLFL